MPELQTPLPTPALRHLLSHRQTYYPASTVLGRQQASIIELARLLAANTVAIARDSHVGECVADTKAATDAIDHRINRPKPPRLLGPCPIVLTHNYGKRICCTELHAELDAIEIQCPTCKTTHNVEHLIDQQVNGCTTNQSPHTATSPAVASSPPGATPPETLNTY